MELDKQKKLKDEAESELAAERLVKEAALREKEAALKREEAALSEKEAALKREEAALKREEAALKREEAALREKAALEEERKKFTAVMSQLGGGGDTLRKKLRPPDGADASLAHAKPLDWATPSVQKVGGNMLVKNTTTNTCVFSLVIHEVPEALLEALLGDQPKMGKMLFQKVLEDGVA
ncbi:hypothetical protein TrVE_jg3046 [Triparma verrucosa]|uniref:Uncharacterized protein n=1 Tax=Triparma verrucosa TaxID=1606542 RepID=A0A9W7C4A1_9STRA|nr:hypothetical protein TrVE_jg3046 [Triparma verrucosa]